MKTMLNVNLLDGIYKASQEKGNEYLLYLDIDRLVAPCYEAVSQTPKKPRYGGWESRGISGHSIGHCLSAVSAMYAVTRDGKLLEKLEYAVNELAHIQSYDPDGYVSGFPRECFDKTFTGDFEVAHFNLGGQWVPWYSIHKIYAGLIDAYLLAGNGKALEVVIKLSDWAKKGTDKLNDEKFQRMLICEHGGMNEAMADLYLITGNKDYLELAIRFCHQAILEPLARGVDELEGKHANTQIPKVIGAAKLYEITGDETYKKMAVFFWNEVTRNRSYIIGGNSNNEHFGPVNSEKLGVETLETCNTYNMLKLTEHLFRWSQDAEYMDFYENALYNHILASQDPDSGMKTYFMATEPGHFKVYCTPDQSFWCCTGTGMENPARYTRQIYYREQDELYVNLFIASEIRLEDKHIKLRQESDFPRTDRTRLIFEEADKAVVTLHIRVPYWVSGAVTAVVNGKETYSRSESGYLSIERAWTAGDVIEIALPMELHVYTAKDDPCKVGFRYGPIALSGALGTENFPETDILDDHMKLHHHPLIEVPTLVAAKEDVKQWIKPVEGSPLTFETNAVGQPGNVKITLIPYYELHHQRYTLYWKLMDEESYKTYRDKEKEELDRLRAITVDFVQPNEQQPEVEHQLRMEHSNSGYSNDARRGWRESLGEGYFSYEMAVEPNKPMYLQITYFGSDKEFNVDGIRYERDFAILIDETVISNQQLQADKPGQLVEIYYDIPMDLTEGKRKVEVKFASVQDKSAGRIFGVRIVNQK
jgi:DUF1680 family protein